MRKLSYVFVGLAATTPLILYWQALRARRAYELAHGFSPEGKGQYDLLVLGFRGMFVFAALAIVCAAIAYARSTRRSSMQLAEILLMCLPVVAVVTMAVHAFPNLPTTLYVLTGVR